MRLKTISATLRIKLTTSAPIIIISLTGYLAVLLYFITTYSHRYE